MESVKKILKNSRRCIFPVVGIKPSSYNQCEATIHRYFVDEVMTRKLWGIGGRRTVLVRDYVRGWDS